MRAIGCVSQAAASLAAQFATVSPETVQAAVLAQIQSPEATHRGYVISDITTAKCAAENAPTAAVTLKITESDLAVRRSGQRVDSATGILYKAQEIAELQTTVDGLLAEAVSTAC